MDHQPRVSVIVPAKDQAPYISDALASLTRQFNDPADLEVLVVDDGSTDGTGELAARFADRLPGLRILRNDVPVGLATARNQGLDQARGGVLAYLDGDDWLAPGHLAHCADELHRLDVEFVRVDHIRATGGSRALHRAPQARRAVPLDPRESILPDTESSMVDYPYAWAGVFHRSLADRGLLRFPDGLFTAEDRPWIWRLHLQSRAYAVVNSPGILYRRGVSSSLTQIYDRRQLDFVPAFRQSFDLVAADSEAGRFWPKAARQFLAVAAHHLSRRANMDAVVRRELDDAIRSCLQDMPDDVRSEGFRRLDRRRKRLLRPLLPAGQRLRGVLA
jgi:glycosyltransferase involved in cell wall biosynthesis